MALVTLAVRVAREEHDYLDRLASQHEGILSKQGVVRLLLQQAERSGWDPLDGTRLPRGMVSKSKGPGVPPVLFREDRNSSSSKNLDPSLEGSKEDKEVSKKAAAHARELTSPRDREENPRAKRDPFSRKELPADAIPPELSMQGDLLQEFWAVKKGTRSERVWKRVCGKLLGWTPEERTEALTAACNAGWGDVFEPKVNTPAQRYGGQKSIAELSKEMEGMPSLDDMLRAKGMKQ
jgi:hypothetical protein